ncbi:MAG: hypothetical protein JF597_34590 [Streptomyces sp.]|uniref:hypothetical protein n=1 Tax=Streptomyces sp. TaxID=1931 RepID=UPI0025EFCAFA|nr:hypothetical protein [Streptomyces sp.]MBW8798522.1 hypothetical protein [Streptomyces sp.]
MDQESVADNRHGTAGPVGPEFDHVASKIEAIASYPTVWPGTALILDCDVNDGLFARGAAAPARRHADEFAGGRRSAVASVSTRSSTAGDWVSPGAHHRATARGTPLGRPGGG